MPGPSVRHTIPHEPIKPAGGASHHQRFRPYEVPQRPVIQFTMQDIDKILYGKQDLRVVQIGDSKQSPPARTSLKNATANPEDKNKPKCMHTYFLYWSSTFFFYVISASQFAVQTLAGLLYVKS